MQNKPFNNLNVNLNVQGMPGVLFNLRKEMANLLRARANGTMSENTRKELRIIAADFEVGITS